MRRWFKRIGLAAAIIGIVVAFGSWWAVRQTQQVPEFYARLTEQPSTPVDSARRAWQADLAQLKEDASQLGPWQARFSDGEINAWLMEELPKTLPRLLAGGAREPRVVIEDGKILAAARVQNHRIDTVLSCEVGVELTEQPNLLAIRVLRLRAGALPLPLQHFMRGISQELAKGGIEVEWDQTETGPVALVTIPSEHPDYVHKPVVVESVELRAGELVLAGNTGQLAHHAYAPQGPIYRFASYRSGENNNRQTARVLRRSSREHLR